MRLLNKILDAGPLLVLVGAVLLMIALTVLFALTEEPTYRKLVTLEEYRLNPECSGYADDGFIMAECPEDHPFRLIPTP